MLRSQALEPAPETVEPDLAFPEPVEPDLALHQGFLEPSPEPSPEPCWTWLGFAPRLPGTFSGTFSGTSLNLTRRLHQRTPELFWAEDPISLCCWGIKKHAFCSAIRQLCNLLSACTFWFRSCTLQSRSKRWAQPPCPSARTWTCGTLWQLGCGLLGPRNTEQVDHVYNVYKVKAKFMPTHWHSQIKTVLPWKTMHCHKSSKISYRMATSLNVPRVVKELFQENLSAPLRLKWKRCLSNHLHLSAGKNMRLLNAFCMLFACFLHAFDVGMLGCWDVETVSAWYWAVPKGSLGLAGATPQRFLDPGKMWQEARNVRDLRDTYETLTRHVRNLGLNSKASLSSSSCRTSPRQIRTGKRPTEVYPNKKRTPRITILKCENYVWLAWFFVPSEAVRSGMWDSCQMCVWTLQEITKTWCWPQQHKAVSSLSSSFLRNFPGESESEPSFAYHGHLHQRQPWKWWAKADFHLVTTRCDESTSAESRRIWTHLDASGRWDALTFQEFSGSHPWAQEWRSFQDLHEDAIQSVSSSGQCFTDLHGLKKENISEHIYIFLYIFHNIFLMLFSWNAQRRAEFAVSPRMFLRPGRRQPSAAHAPSVQVPDRHIAGHRQLTSLHLATMHKRCTNDAQTRLFMADIRTIQLFYVVLCCLYVPFGSIWSVWAYPLPEAVTFRNFLAITITIDAGWIP